MCGSRWLGDCGHFAYETLRGTGEDAQALGKIREYGKGAAAGTGAGALIVGGAGAVLRIRRFRRDIM